MFEMVDAFPEGNFRHCLPASTPRDDEVRASGFSILQSSTDSNSKVGFGIAEYENAGEDEQGQAQRMQPMPRTLTTTEELKNDDGQERVRSDGITDEEGEQEKEGDAMMLMQRKRGHSPTPRRRRRARAARQAERQRQENRHSWSIGAERSRARTETCSKRPLVAPWSRGKGSKCGTSRPSAAPVPAAPVTVTTPGASSSVPDIPPLGEGSGNIMWWSEMLGLQDPMLENDRVLENQTVDCLVENLRAMSPAQRTAMVAQLVPFLGALLAEVTRAISLAQLPDANAAEIVDDDEAEEDEGAFFQLSVAFEDNAQQNQAEDEDQLEDEVNMMQQYDASIPFGSKLSQLQGQLEGFNSAQSNQVACHLRSMMQRIRRLAGATSSQVTDRFQRLEALIASYYVEDVDVPLSLQVWGEGQLRVLIPYLNGGRTPDTVMPDNLLTNQGRCGDGPVGRSTGASSSGDAIRIGESRTLWKMRSRNTE